MELDVSGHVQATRLHCLGASLFAYSQCSLCRLSFVELIEFAAGSFRCRLVPAGPTCSTSCPLQPQGPCSTFRCTSRSGEETFFFFSNTYCSSLENREALSGMFLLGIVFVLCLPKGVNSIRSECSHRFRADADDLESTFAV